ncbi:hypothetical protein [Mycobacterium genavense]|uniref:hypothetical protein n=1 Tax=Mycobacterium genavense TaxID=36812 RepID=UPI0012EB30EA|nr:hypothetical protein [Mycobacterium genavense]
MSRPERPGETSRRVIEVARGYGLSRYWVHQLVNLYYVEGPAAFESHSRRPHHHRHVVSAEVEDKIVGLRKSLSRRGYDAGAGTIAEHLTRDPTITNVPAISTIWCILHKRGFVTPEPHKRPRSAWKRFAADLDDHSRLLLASRDYQPRGVKCGNSPENRLKV